MNGKNDMNDKIEIVHTGCDGLTVALMGNLPAKTLDKLDEIKNLAADMGQDMGLKIGGTEFNVMKSGTSNALGYTFQFHTGRDGIKYQAKRSLDASQWNLRARVTAMFLAVNGFEGAHKQIYADLRAMGAVIIDESVSAVDFCIDLKLDAKDAKAKDKFKLVPANFVHHSKAKRREFYSHVDLDSDELSIIGGRNCETVTIGGKNSRQLSVYNKRAEQVSKRRKDWFEFWGEDKKECPNIWRVEFRFGRDFMRDWNVSTMDDVRNCYGDMLRDSLQCIRYVEAGSDSNISRAKNHPLWNAVVKAFSRMCVDAVSGICRGRITAVQREEAVECYEAQIKGLAASLSVVLDIESTDKSELMKLPDKVAEMIRKHMTYNTDKFDATRKKAADRLIFTRQEVKGKEYV